METITVTKEEFKARAAKIMAKSLKDDDDPQILLVEMLVGGKLLANLTKELFNEESDEESDTEHC